MIISHHDHIRDSTINHYFGCILNISLKSAFNHTEITMDEVHGSSVSLCMHKGNVKQKITLGKSLKKSQKSKGP